MDDPQATFVAKSQIEAFHTPGGAMLIAAMLGLPQGWTVEAEPMRGDFRSWGVTESDQRFYRMRVSGMETAAAMPGGPEALRDLFTAKVLELRAMLLADGIELGEAQKLAPWPWSACDLCGCATAASWSRWPEDKPCHTFRVVCGGCHGKVREVSERALAALHRLSLGAATELVRRLEEFKPAPPRDQHAGVPRPDIAKALGDLPAPERRYQELRGVYNLMGAVARADVDLAKRTRAADDLDAALERADRCSKCGYPGQ